MNKENYILNFVGNNNQILSENMPKLVSVNLKKYIGNKLQECNYKKIKNNNLYFNIFFFIIFILILGSILIFKFKGFKNKNSSYKKQIRDKEYIMSKLIFYNKQNLDNKNRSDNNLINNLSDNNNYPEASLLHRKIYF